MISFPELLQHGASNAWLFIPSAILLGALHGLEPGHSKTMMAAFIVAIRGTIFQAVLLGISAAISHSLVIWALAAVALRYGSRWNAETTEPWFQLASGVIILGIATWMFFRTRHDQKLAEAHFAEEARHHHHHHDDHHDHAHHHHHHAADAEFQDAHERAHANDLRSRFSGRTVTTGQIIVFGLTGGLLPCPAALTVLLICLQLKKFVLGFALVVCFSLGLAMTLVASGSIAAWSVGHASKRFSGFGNFARKAPYASSAILACIGLLIGWQGWRHLYP